MDTPRAAARKLSFWQISVPPTSDSLIGRIAPGVGEAREEMSISYSGEELSIAFNPQFLVDVLRNLDEEEVALELTDALNPGVIRSGKSFLYVIMPIRLT